MDSNEVDVSAMLKVCPACGQLFVPEDELCPQDNCTLKAITDEKLVGTVFDNRFRILSLIGSGGMSTVYKAMHKELGFEVALKMMRLSLLEDEKTRARFIREAEVLRTLKHPNIVSIKEFHITKTGQPYLVMDCLEGETLASTITRRDLDIPEAVNLFLQICSALDHAHAQSVVHRDLKPGNIIITNEQGRQKAMLVDFGIAKLLPSLRNNAQKLTRTGHAFGTPSYMSPEQWRGENVDERSDIYSLGCIMFESLAGTPPLDMESLAQIIFNNAEPSPQPLRQNKAGQPISADLESIIMKCLAFDRSKRYPSAAELQSALQQLQPTAADRAPTIW